MELWIRSQSKEELIKVYNVSINKDNNIIGNLISDDNKSICDYWILGMYDTKKRALEVLDEIQKLLQPQTIINYESKLEFHPEYTVQNIVKTIPKTEIKELSTYVYEMPKE